MGKRHADAAPPTLGELAEINPEIASLEAAAAYCNELQRKIKKMEETRKTILKEIDVMAEALVLPPRVMSNDGTWEIRKAKGKGADKIVAEKLLQYGVPMDVIEAATEQGESWEKYTVVAVPQKKEASQ